MKKTTTDKEIDQLIKDIKKIAKSKKIKGSGYHGGDLFGDDNFGDNFDEPDMDNDQDDTPIHQVEEPVKTNLPNKLKTKKVKAPKTWQRLDEIIKEVNETNLAGRSSNYLGGSLNRDYMIQDPHTGLTYQTTAANGYPLEDQVAAQLEKQKGAGRGLVPGPTGDGYHGGQIKKRKKRSDTGKTKTSEWVQLVKAVSQYEGLPYNKAMTLAKEYRNKGVTVAEVNKWIAEEGK